MKLAEAIPILGATIDYYTKILSFELASVHPKHGGPEWTQVDAGQVSFVLIPRASPEAGEPRRSRTLDGGLRRGASAPHSGEALAGGSGRKGRSRRAASRHPEWQQKCAGRGRGKSGGSDMTKKKTLALTAFAGYEEHC
jgi:hypothetical protein